MKSWRGLVLTVALAAAAAFALTSVDSSPRTVAGAPERIPGRYIVLLRGNVNAAAFADAEGRRLGFTADVLYSAAVNGFAAEMPERAAQALRRNPNVSSVEQDQVVTIADQVLPTGVDRIDAEDNPASGIDGVDVGLDVDIAVIDTGIDVDHPDLNVVGGARFQGAFFFCGNGSGSYDDDNGHGTHVAGSAAARDNGQGVVGVAPGARLWAVKVLDSGGRGSVSCLIRAVDWVTANAGTIDVVNMSLSTGNAPSLCTAIANSIAAGVAYAVAVGNAGQDAANYTPANCGPAITVSAFADFDGAPGGLGAATCRSDVDDTFADFSNFGANVDIAAPGVCIESTWFGGGYLTASGTSMATPHVAGAVALFRVATGYAGAADSVSLLAAMTAAGWTVPQASECGFSGDPDAFREPVLYLGASCSPAPVPTSTPQPPATSTPTGVSTATPAPTSTPLPSPTSTSAPTTPTSTPAPTGTPVPGGSLVPNGRFDAPSYGVGTPPANHGFDSGDLSGWSASGGVAVQDGGPGGFFAALTNGSSLLSAPFDVPAGAQTLSIDIGFLGGSACLSLSVLSGPDYTTSTGVSPADCGSSGWRTRAINVTTWGGQSIRLRVQSSGTTGLDNAGVMRVVLDQWDVSGPAGSVPELMSGGPDGSYGRAPNAMAPVTAAFQVPGGNVTLTYKRRVASGGIYNLYVLCGPTFTRCQRVVTNDSASAGQWVTKEVNLSAYAGQVIKLEFYNAGTFDLDSLELVVR
ncbi:MAG TPA: S8 family serine peptidase [Dehalococcoidia bacterium]|nr:S8 family serine peptidase [Dehalococcoidia bacterium]